MLDQRGLISLGKPDANHLKLVSLASYPNRIDDLDESALSVFLEHFGYVAYWIADRVRQWNGYGMAFPQVGIPINAGIVRFNLADTPRLFFNLHRKVLNSGTGGNRVRTSMEACYSVAFGLVPFVHNRWPKVQAIWTNADNTVETKVLRFEKRAQRIPEAAIWQHEVEHMQPDFVQRIQKLLALPINKIPARRIRGTEIDVLTGARKLDGHFEEPDSHA